MGPGGSFDGCVTNTDIFIKLLVYFIYEQALLKLKLQSIACIYENRPQAFL